MRGKAVVLISFFLLLTAAGFVSAQEDLFPEGFLFSGSVGGTGTYFEIKNSEYLNVSLESSEEVSVVLESIPRMISLIIEPVANETNSVVLTLEGLEPNKTYYQYQDSYKNGEEIITNENGTYSWTQDLSQPRHIWFQETKSTIFLPEDCPNYGTWDEETRTCVLDQDLSESVEIAGGDITLDCQGYQISGSGAYGVFLNGFWKRYAGGLKNITIKNCNISNFSYGIYTEFINQSFLENNTSHNNVVGIQLLNSSNNLVSDNLTQNNRYGISLSYSGNNTLTNNQINSNQYALGFTAYSGNNVLRNNTLLDNQNSIHLCLSGCGPQADPVQDIDPSNTINGKPIYYLVNQTNKEIPTDAGFVGLVNSSNITVKNLNLDIPNIYAIFLVSTTNSRIENNHISNSLVGIYLASSTNNTFSENTIKDTRRETLYFYYSPNNLFYHNNFINNIRNCPGIFNSPSDNANSFDFGYPFGGNFWSNYAGQDLKSGPSQDQEGSDGIGDTPYQLNRLFNNACLKLTQKDNYPFMEENGWEALPPPPPLTPECCSSVVFIPGHQGAKLFSIDDPSDQLWPPTFLNIGDVEDLYISEESLNPDGSFSDTKIFTDGIVEKLVETKDVYADFSEFMNSIDEDVLIHEWTPFPYDWRKDPKYVVVEDVRTRTGSYNMIAEIERLAANSLTGKVTLITHSNGGLVAKYLIEELENQGKEGLVDKLIMVAVPQLGTPQTVVTLLHGDPNWKKNLVMSASKERTLGENMLSAYNLLPSNAYFDIVTDPVVIFEDDSVNQAVANLNNSGDDSISLGSALRDFLTGAGDYGPRSEPEDNDVATPNVLDSILMGLANQNHVFLDGWIPPDNIEITQVVGWGKPTVKSIKYYTKKKRNCGIFSPITGCPFEYELKHRVDRTTIEGDSTVLYPSADYLKQFSGTIYLNLIDISKSGDDRNHLDVSGTEILREIIAGILKAELNLAQFGTLATDIKPTPDNEMKRLETRGFSPITIDAYDTAGRHTRLSPDSTDELKIIDDDIPGSFYLELGEGKYLGLDRDTPARVVITGIETGTAKFEIENFIADKSAGYVEYVNLPVQEGTTIEFEVVDAEVIGDIEVDIEGDGETDFVLDESSISTQDNLAIFASIIKSLDLNKGIRISFISKLYNAIELLNQMLYDEAIDKLIDLQNQLLALSGKKLSEDEAVKLITIIEEIKEQIYAAL